MSAEIGTNNEPDIDELGFISVSDNLDNERDRRVQKVRKSLPFGVNFIDRVLRAIEVDDLILLGASTGAGKTELATKIALQNVLNGKRVHFFALEASEDEIQRRMLFSIIADLYMKDKGQKLYVNYYDWYRLKWDHLLSKYEDEAKAIMKKYSGLKIFYRKRAFGSKEFRRAFAGIAHETDLIIVDHLHYFDLESEDENRAIKDIMKDMRDLVLIHEKPILLIAHLRKLDVRQQKLVPDLADFHGSSDISKIATKAITLAAGEHLGEDRYRTYAKFSKCRQDSSVTKFIVAPTWDSNLSRYEEEFQIGKEVRGKFEAIENKYLPSFMKKGIT